MSFFFEKISFTTVQIELASPCAIFLLLCNFFLTRATLVPAIIPIQIAISSMPLPTQRVSKVEHEIFNIKCTLIISDL